MEDAITHPSHVLSDLVVLFNKCPSELGPIGVSSLDCIGNLHNTFWWERGQCHHLRMSTRTALAQTDLANRSRGVSSLQSFQAQLSGHAAIAVGADCSSAISLNMVIDAVEAGWVLDIKRKG